MTRWTVFFLIIAIIAGVFAFTGVVVTAIAIARVLFWIFLILFIVGFLFGRTPKRPA